jgi:hypothetical protein
MSGSGLTQRKKPKEGDTPTDGNNSPGLDSRDSQSSFKGESYKSNSQDLTIMEEVVLLGLKDSEVTN